MTITIDAADIELYKAQCGYFMYCTLGYKEKDPEFKRGVSYLLSDKIKESGYKILTKWKMLTSVINQSKGPGKRQATKNNNARDKEFTQFFHNQIVNIDPPLRPASEFGTAPEPQIVSNSKSEIDPDEPKTLFELESINQDSKLEPSLPPKLIIESTPIGDDFWIKHYINNPGPSSDPIPSSIWPDSPIEESTPHEHLNLQPIPMAGYDHIQSMVVSEYAESVALLGLPLVIIDCPPEHLENLCNWLIDNYNLIPAYDEYYSPSSDRLGIICKEFLDLYFDLKSYCDKCGHDIKFYDFCKHIDGNLSITRILHDCRLLITDKVLPQSETSTKRPVGRPRIEKDSEIKQAVGRPKLYDAESDLYLKTLISNVEYAKKLLVDANYELKSYKLSLKGGTND